MEAGQNRTKTFKVPVRYTEAMLRVACLRKVRIEFLALSQRSGDSANQAELGASEHVREATGGLPANPGGEDHLWRTPRDERELAMMMRDEHGKLQCPSGFDFASYTSAAAASKTQRNASPKPESLP